MEHTVISVEPHPQNKQNVHVVIEHADGKESFRTELFANDLDESRIKEHCAAIEDNWTARTTSLDSLKSLVGTKITAAERVR